MPSEASDPAKMAAYASERGWAAGAKGFTNQLREHLQGEADRLDLEVGLTRTVQLDRQRRPIVPRIAASEVPASVAEAVRLVMDEMPERSLLEALANTAHWGGLDAAFWTPIADKFGNCESSRAVPDHDLCLRVRAWSYAGRPSFRWCGITGGIELCRSTAH